MRKKDEQTIQLMNERLRRLEERVAMNESLGNKWVKNIVDRLDAIEDDVEDDDPMPPGGSIVVDCDGLAWQRTGMGDNWFCALLSPRERTWQRLVDEYGPITVLRHGNGKESS